MDRGIRRIYKGEEEGERDSSIDKTSLLFVVRYLGRGV